MRIGLASSKSDARRKVEQRGVRVDSVVADGSTTVPTSGTQLIQVGPRNFRRIRWS